MLLGRLRIRGKLAVLVVIPLLAVVALTVPVVLDGVEQSRRAGDTADAVGVAGRIGKLIQDIQVERMLGVGYLIRTVPRDRLEAQAAKVVDHAARLAGGSAGADPEFRLPSRVSAAVSRVETLVPLRAGARNGTVTPDKLITGYGEVVAALLDSLALERSTDVTTPLGRQVLALDASLRTDEMITVGAAYLVVAAGTKKPEALLPFYANMAVLQSSGERFSEFATPAQERLYTQTQTELQRRLGLRLGGTDTAPATANPLESMKNVPIANVFSALETVVGPGRVVSERLITDVTNQVTEQRDRELTTAYLVAGLSLLVILLVGALNVAVVRAVVRPLARLTKTADRVARLTEEELTRVADDEAESPAPAHLDPIEVEGQDEIGELAGAFARLQGTAVDLVARQATSRRNVALMFGHVGRRTQNLVSRQISLIDRLEAEEVDPERLQRLYQLDHVSSRLRRNAGSLVVLSGATGANEHVNPVRLADVVRLALGEIEYYTRVDIRVPEELSLVPAVINDVVLMIAELMENATVFSPPHTRVTVSAHQRADGIHLIITDHGIGLSDEQLARENGRLRQRERLDLAPTGVLGLFVVGRLARRHDLGVTLAPTQGGGLTATVLIPGSLVVGARPVAVPMPAAVPTAPASTTPAFGPAEAASVPPAASVPDPVADSAAVTTVLPRIGANDPAPPVAPPTVPGSPVAPVSPVAPGSPAAPDEPASTAFNVAVVSRASRSIATGTSWSAFVPHQQDPADEQTGAGDQPAVGTGFDPATPGGGTPGAVPAGPVRPDPMPAGDVSGALAGLAALEPATEIRQPTEIRSGGAVLAGPAPSGPAAEASPAAPPVSVSDQPTAIIPVITAESARALVEDFDAGVRRAQSETQVLPVVGAPQAPPAPLAVTGPPVVPAPPPSAAPVPPAAAPTTSTSPRPLPIAPTPLVSPEALAPAPLPRPAPPPLTRRQPGATLEGKPELTRPNHPVVASGGFDPDEARELVEQFEAGVFRALGEVGSPYKPEEGSRQ